MIRTVLGKLPVSEGGVTLPHEHVCCYSNVLYQAGGAAYMDKTALFTAATAWLKELKEMHHLGTFVDCTPLSLGRDVELLKRISAETGVHVVCATGFYHTEDPMLCIQPPERLAEFLIADAENTHAGIIKCAVERETVDRCAETLLRACAKAQKATGLPLVMHSNAKNQNALAALEILFDEGVAPRAVTVGHLSDTEDADYVKSIAARGCYIGLDRMYGKTEEAYLTAKLQMIRALCGAGYEDRILLSHDALFFNGFTVLPQLNPRPRFNYCFEALLPQLPPALAYKITVENPANMWRKV